MAPNPTALAALLASHPEECAAVVAALSVYDGANVLVIADVLRLDGFAITRERIDAIVGAMMSADLCIRGSEGRHFIYAMQRADRRAIARMGAAAWLRERVTP